jgi:hypothetical protein
MKRNAVFAAVLTGSLAVGAVAFGPFAVARDKGDTYARNEERKWTDAERARDALDHLKKAHEHLVVLARDRANPQAEAARKAVDEAIDHVDRLIDAIDRPARK